MVPAGLAEGFDLQKLEKCRNRDPVPGSEMKDTNRELAGRSQLVAHIAGQPQHGTRGHEIGCHAKPTHGVGGPGLRHVAPLGRPTTGYRSPTFGAPCRTRLEPDEESRVAFMVAGHLQLAVVSGGRSAPSFTGVMSGAPSDMMALTGDLQLRLVTLHVLVRTRT